MSQGQFSHFEGSLTVMRLQGPLENEAPKCCLTEAYFHDPEFQGGT